MTTAAIYRRISLDREGLALGVTRQYDDCLELAHSLGLTVPNHLVFDDNDRGASDLSSKARPGYAAMVKAVREGKMKHIIAYSNSRLTRRPREFEDLIQLHTEYGVVIHTVVSGEDDLSTADGRMVARIKANIDAGEAERTGERIRRARLENARQGKPWGGPRPFGWLDGGVDLHPDEAPVAPAGHR